MFTDCIEILVFNAEIAEECAEVRRVFKIVSMQTKIQITADSTIWIVP